MNVNTSILLLAALYHESVRHAVAQGQTVAHTVGSARPFTEFADLPVDAMRGRLLTAELLLRTLDLQPLRPMGDAAEVEPHVDALAQAIHRAERGAVRRGLVVVKLDPPRPWLPFDKLPEAAQNGRRHQARFFLSRFAVRPKQGDPLQDFHEARARCVAGPAFDAARATCLLTGGGEPSLRWTGTPAEIELLFSAIEEMTGGAWWCMPLDSAGKPSAGCVGMWQSARLYEDERGGGFAAEGVGGFTDPATGLWIEAASKMGPWKGADCHQRPTRSRWARYGRRTHFRPRLSNSQHAPRCRSARADLVRMLRAAQAERDDLVTQRLLLEDERDTLSRALRQAAEDSGALTQRAAREAASLTGLLKGLQTDRDGVVDLLLSILRRYVLPGAGARAAQNTPTPKVSARATFDGVARSLDRLADLLPSESTPGESSAGPTEHTRLGRRRGEQMLALAGLLTNAPRVEVISDPNGGPPDIEGDDRTATSLAEVARAQDLLAAAASAASKCDANGYGAMLQQVAGKSLEVLRGLVPSAIEQQARELIALRTEVEPPTALLRLGMAQAHVREAVDLLVRVLQQRATAESHQNVLWELDPELSGMVHGWQAGLDSCSDALATAVRRYVDLAAHRSETTSPKE